jgi:uncharacterized protein (DUF2267 family)
MKQERFVEEVMQRAGFQQPAMASLAIDATLEILGQRLTAGEVQELSHQLPGALGQTLRRGPHGGTFGRDELYRRVSRREGVRLGFAVEHAQVVCQVLAEGIDDELRERLHHRLPPEISELITPRPASTPPPPRPRPPTPPPRNKHTERPPGSPPDPPAAGHPPGQ